MKSPTFVDESELLRSLRAGGLPDRWYVSDGQRTVGPIDYELLVRGVRDQAVGAHCWLRNEGWQVWQPVENLARALAGSVGAAPRTTQVRRVDPLARTIVDAGQPEISSFEAILEVATATFHAEACLILERGEDGGGVVRAARGPGSLDLLGERVSALDRVLLASAGGGIVTAEPHPGPVGSALLHRLRRAGATGAGALMVPVHTRANRLVGLLELGRPQPFRAAEIGEVAKLADRVAEHLDRHPRRVMH